jgi:hypothetical protein
MYEIISFSRTLAYIVSLLDKSDDRICLILKGTCTDSAKISAQTTIFLKNSEV